MNRKSRLRITLLLLISGFMISLSGCGEVNNEDNFAVVTGRVLNSASDPTGVEGVVVWVESDPTSDAAYYGGDISVLTDQDGVYRGEVFLGYITIGDVPAEESEGGIFNVDYPRFVGDARVLMIYNGSFLDIGGGVTLQRGRTLELWDVYLTDFSAGKANESVTRKILGRPAD
jgi:hypothetical protein